MIEDIKQFEEYDRKHNSSGISMDKDNENESNIHKKLKGVIQSGYYISETSKESSDKDEGTTRCNRSIPKEGEGKQPAG